MSTLRESEESKELGSSRSYHLCESDVSKYRCVVRMFWQDPTGAKPPKPCELAEELLEGCGAAVELLESRLCRRYALEHVCFLLCQILPIADARMGTRARIRGSRGLEA